MKLLEMNILVAMGPKIASFQIILMGRNIELLMRSACLRFIENFMIK